MDILKKIVEVGTDLLEKYKSMVGSNHLSLEEAKRIRNELIANINYKEIMNSDYQNALKKYTLVKTFVTDTKVGENHTKQLYYIYVPSQE